MEETEENERVAILSQLQHPATYPHQLQIQEHEHPASRAGQAMSRLQNSRANQEYFLSQELLLQMQHQLSSRDQQLQNQQKNLIKMQEMLQQLQEQQKQNEHYLEIEYNPGGRFRLRVHGVVIPIAVTGLTVFALYKGLKNPDIVKAFCNAITSSANQAVSYIAEGSLVVEILTKNYIATIAFLKSYFSGEILHSLKQNVSEADISDLQFFFNDVELIEGELIEFDTNFDDIKREVEREMNKQHDLEASKKIQLCKVSISKFTDKSRSQKYNIHQTLQRQSWQDTRKKVENVVPQSQISQLQPATVEQIKDIIQADVNSIKPHQNFQQSVKEGFLLKCQSPAEKNYDVSRSSTDAGYMSQTISQTDFSDNIENDELDEEALRKMDSETLKERISGILRSFNEDKSTKLFSYLQHVERLDLSWMDIQPPEVKSLSDAVRILSNPIEHVDLHGNHISDEGIIAISACLHKIEELNLSSCGLTSQGLKYVSKAINQSPRQMRMLDISWNKLGNEEIIALSSCLSSIDDLHLASCDMDDEQMSILSEAITNLPKPVRTLC